MKQLLILPLFLGLFSFSTIAGDSSSGCGLGWAVFKKNSLVSSSLRMTTNAFFLNTIAMTFGTSGCAQHSIVKAEKKGLHYVDANMKQLMVEMAAGEGEFVDGLAATLGCEAQSFGQKMQNNYSSVFSHMDMSARKVLDNVGTQVLTDKELAQACGLI
jgi:hypothetical protein